MYRLQEIGPAGAAAAYERNSIHTEKVRFGVLLDEPQMIVYSFSPDDDFSGFDNVFSTDIASNAIVAIEMAKDGLHLVGQARTTSEIKNMLLQYLAREGSEATANKVIQLSTVKNDGFAYILFTREGSDLKLILRESSTLLIPYQEFVDSSN